MWHSMICVGAWQGSDKQVVPVQTKRTLEGRSCFSILVMPRALLQSLPNSAPPAPLPQACAVHTASLTSVSPRHRTTSRR